MFRLVTLLGDETEAHPVYPDADGYGSEPAAWAAYAASPAGFCGVGKYNPDGRLVELIIDRVLDAEHGPQRWDQLARTLGVPVRTIPMALRAQRSVDIRAVRLITAEIEREFPRRVREALWRRALCRDLHTEPLAVAGVVDAVRGLSHWQVLDLFPHLQALAAELPDCIRTELRRHIGDKALGAGITALRLGL